MEYFVEKGSVVREIWGKGDTILFIFAGASAEFALNKAVDWLYFTGKLPADPLGRLFSTVTYARNIVFSKKEAACKAIDKITSIHSFELLERKLTLKEKEEVFDVFHRFGKQMNLQGLPENFNEWLVMRNNHLNSQPLKTNVIHNWQWFGDKKGR